jgi:uncharacterized protein YndB with AHSA1/START domain
MLGPSQLRRRAPARAYWRAARPRPRGDRPEPPLGAEPSKPSALTDPGRLARWYGQVEGELRPGGEFRLHVESADLDATGRVEACEPPQRLLVTNRETDESYLRGKEVPPYDEAIEATLTADGDQTILVIEVRGMPLDKIAFYGAGWQIHAESLAAYIAGREQGDGEARWDELVPAYQALAADVS